MLPHPKFDFCGFPDLPTYQVGSSTFCDLGLYRNDELMMRTRSTCSRAISGSTSGIIQHASCLNYRISNFRADFLRKKGGGEPHNKNDRSRSRKISSRFFRDFSDMFSWIAGVCFVFALNCDARLSRKQLRNSSERDRVVLRRTAEYYTVWPLLGSRIIAQ